MPRQCVVQRHHHRRIAPHEPQRQAQHHDADLLRVPGTPAEEAVER
jgi:hypothetical protein